MKSTTDGEGLPILFPRSVRVMYALKPFDQLQMRKQSETQEGRAHAVCQNLLNAPTTRAGSTIHPRTIFLVCDQNPNSALEQASVLVLKTVHAVIAIMALFVLHSQVRNDLIENLLSRHDGEHDITARCRAAPRGAACAWGAASEPVPPWEPSPCSGDGWYPAAPRMLPPDRRSR